MRTWKLFIDWYNHKAGATPALGVFHVLHLFRQFRLFPRQDVRYPKHNRKCGW
jgi:hypothetical protein